MDVKVTSLWIDNRVKLGYITIQTFLLNGGDFVFFELPVTFCGERREVYLFTTTKMLKA
jgi:hypothetical protein